MKRTIAALILAAGVFGASAAPGPAQSRDKTAAADARGGVTLEFWGGVAHLGPSDLNLRADFDNAYVDYYFRQKFNFLRAWRQGSYSYLQTAGSTTRFASMTGANPLGIRARIGLDRVWALSLGVTYLSRTVTTYYTAAYLITDLDPDNVEFNGSCRQVIDFPQWRLAVRGWTPMIAVHARPRLLGRFQLEGYAGAGLLLARCASTREYSLKTTEPDGFWELNDYLEEMQGRGTGVSLEIGAQAGLPLSGRLGVFIEGGYAYRVASKITGSYAYRRRHEDANAAPFETRVSVDDGIWRVASGTYNNYWGRWNASWPEIRPPDQTAGSNPFRLDLSGFQVRIGLSCRL
jgi:hypothetical protein